MEPLPFDGRIHKISDTQKISETFTKREFVISEDIGGKVNEVKFEFIGELGAVLDNYKVGEEVTVMFIIRGNAYQDKHFVNLNAVAIGERLAENDKLRELREPSKVKTRPIVKQVESQEDDLPF